MQEITGSKSPDPWRWLFDSRSSKQIEDEIAEELQLHFDQMVKTEMQLGKDEVEAKREAAERFGDLGKYANECKQIQTWERMMLQKIQVGLGSVLIVLLAMSYFDTRNLASQLSSIESQLAAFQGKVTSTEEPEDKPLSKVDDPDWMEIFVCDEADKPIEGADVRVEWATADRDRYESYTRKTNAQGLLHVLRDESVILQYLQAHSEGTNWVRRTLTQSRQDYLEQHKLELLPSMPITIELSDANSGRRLSNAEIVNPFSRLRYQPERTDNEGRVTLDWYSRGETATLSGTVYLAKDQLDSREAELLGSGRGTIHRINGKPHFSYSFSQNFDVDKALNDDVFQLKVNLKERGGGGFGGGGGQF